MVHDSPFGDAKGRSRREHLVFTEEDALLESVEAIKPAGNITERWRRNDPMSGVHEL